MYPRQMISGQLVNDDQLVGTQEHLARYHRVLFLGGVITGDLEMHDSLLAFDSLSHEPIKLVIASPGGDLDSTFLLYDTIRLIKSPVYTFGRYCASAACLLLAAGKRRYLSAHCKTMLHLPFGRAAGDARDWDIQHKEMAKYRERMVELLIECGVQKKRDEILLDIDRDFWLEPKEAIEYGLADEIMTQETMEGWLK